MSTRKQVAFIGLGVMGYPMARHLSNAGHGVTVYNRTPSKSEQWVAENGGTRQLTPREAAVEAEIVFLCVGNDDDVRSVVLGVEGVLTDGGSRAIGPTDEIAYLLTSRDACPSEHGAAQLNQDERLLSIEI